MALDPIKALRDRLATHAKDARARMFGLDSTLTALDAAVYELARRQAVLATAYLELLQAFASDRHPHAIKLHASRVDELGALSDHASSLARSIRDQVTDEATR